MLIWFLYINRSEYCDALGASFRNVLLKWTKDYANRYYRESFYHKTSYMISVKSRVLLKCPCPKTSRIVPNDLTLLPDDHRCENRVFSSEENFKPKSSVQCIRSYFQGIPTSGLRCADLSWKSNFSLYWCSKQHPHIFFSELSTRESLGLQSWVNLFRNSLAQTVPKWWNVTEGTTRLLPIACYRGFSVNITVIWRCASRTTILSSLSIVIMFELRTWDICLTHLTAVEYVYRRYLAASNASSNVVLLQTYIFSIQPRLLHQ